MKSILNTLIHKTPPRVQRFIMFLQKYDFVEYSVPGRDLTCSDTLSRAQLKEQSPEISETEVNCQVHPVKSSIPISIERLKQLKVEMLNDKTLQRVASYAAQKSQNQLNPELKAFCNLRDELTIVNNLMFNNGKIAIPSTLTREMNQILQLVT